MDEAIKLFLFLMIIMFVRKNFMDFEKVYGLERPANQILDEIERQEKEKSAEKKQLAEIVGKNQAEIKNLVRIEAEKTFRAKLEMEFLEANPHATAEDFARLYPQLRDAKLIGSIQPKKSDIPSDIQKFFDESN